mgnify:CR=1 FL=1
MPYIDNDRRDDILNGESLYTIGELVFQLTMVVLKYLPRQPKFADYDAVIGALECAKLELYRRRVAVYEDQKIRENGDVY